MSVPFLTVLNPLPALGKGNFVEADKVPAEWLHCFVQCHKARGVSWCHAGDAVQMILLGRVANMRQLELIQENTESNNKYHSRHSPKWDHQYIWGWHLETFALRRFLSGYRLSRLSPKWNIKPMQLLSPHCNYYRSSRQLENTYSTRNFHGNPGSH